MRVGPFKTYPFYIRLFIFFQTRKYRQALEPTLAWGILGRAYLFFLFLVQFFLRKSSSLDLGTRHLVMLYISKIRTCAFCVDLHQKRAYAFFEKEKVESVLDFEASPHFNEKEKCLLSFTRKISTPGEKVSDALFAKLKQHLTDQELVEWTALIAFQNMSSIFNSALDLSEPG